MAASAQLAIEALILERAGALKLSRVHLVRRVGFKNVAKGRRAEVKRIADCWLARSVGAAAGGHR